MLCRSDKMPTNAKLVGVRLLMTQVPLMFGLPGHAGDCDGRAVRQPRGAGVGDNRDRDVSSDGIVDLLDAVGLRSCCCRAAGRTGPSRGR